MSDGVFRRLFLPLVLIASASATTLPSISEDDQIRDAATIFRGRAERIDSALETSTRGRAIITTVQFTPLKVYKGSAPGSVSLRFLGGKVGDLELKVDGMPQFRVGGEYVLFVSGQGNRVCPVVGWSEGSLRVNRETNAAGEVSPAGEGPGRSESGVQARSRRVLPAGKASALPEFEARLKTRVAELSKQP